MAILPPAPYNNEFLSPNGEYLFRLTYVSEFRFGDQLGFAEIIRLNDKSVIWKYTGNYAIREVTTNPWSIDSTTVYFSTVVEGNEIVCFDINNKLLLSIFRTRHLPRTLNWLNFVPTSFNGVVFTANTSTGEGNTLQTRTTYFVYVYQKKELVNLNDMTNSAILAIADCDKENCVVVVTTNSVQVIDVGNNEVVFSSGSDTMALSENAKLFVQYSNLNSTLYIHKSDPSLTEYYKIARQSDG